jgi:hypothetical protein
MRKPNVEFPDRVVSASVDEFFSEVSREQSIADLHALTIDMSGVTFVTLDAWQRLISYLVALQRKGVDPTIIPPKNEGVINYMRSFGVDYGFKTALDVGILSYAPIEIRSKAAEKEWIQPSIPFKVPMGILVHESDQTVKRGTRNSSEPFGELPRRRTAFAFHALDVKNVNNFAEAANVEKSVWMTPNVNSAFRSVTGKSAEYFAPRAVFEGVFNSLRHEGATVIQTVTQLSPAKKPGDISRLAVSFWDDGVGLFETMRSALERKIDVRTGHAGDFPSEFSIMLREKNKDGFTVGFEGTVSNDLVPDELEIAKLITPIFPYISSNPLGGIADVAPETESSDKRYATRGMGLFLLVQTVCHMFDGEVEFRSGRFKMDVKAPKNSAAKKLEDQVEVDIFRFDVNIEVNELDVISPAGTHIVCKMRSVDDAQQKVPF